jgi:dihydrofolate synthase/folylpolyglutamate synthase
MGDPQTSYPVVHVTGTNGKGSTVRMTTALLLAKGLTVGTYTSPHLERLNERLAWDGEAIEDEAFGEVLLALRDLEPFVIAEGGPLCDAFGEAPTWFELLTAAAYRWFADVAVDAAVVEVGLGGRYDATNVADAAVAVVTNVDLDHVDILGSTRAEIAAEKAGIIKAGSAVVLGEDDPSLVGIFEAEAERVGAAAVWRRHEDFGCEVNRLAIGGRLLDLRTPGARYEDVFVPLHGAHQGDNAAAALAAAEAFFGEPLREEVVAEGLAATTVPGRMEVVARRPLVVLDGAHNPAGARAAGVTLAEDFALSNRVIVVMGCLRGRDPLEMLQGLGPERIDHLIACPAPSPRGLPVEAVAEAARSLGLAAEEAASVASALETARRLAAPTDLVLVTGSLYVVGAARAVLRGGPAIA